MPEPEDHLRLEARGHHSIQSEAKGNPLCEMNSPRIHMSPDGLAHLELFPHCRIGKADLAADRLISSFPESFVKRKPDPVPALQIKTGSTLRRWQRRMRGIARLQKIDYESFVSLVIPHGRIPPS